MSWKHKQRSCQLMGNRGGAHNHRSGFFIQHFIPRISSWWRPIRAFDGPCGHARGQMCEVGDHDAGMGHASVGLTAIAVTDRQIWPSQLVAWKPAQIMCSSAGTGRDPKLCACQTLCQTVFDIDFEYLLKSYLSGCATAQRQRRSPFCFDTCIVISASL